jgi:thiol-disulfide isomerase/thioredoxin
MNARGIIFAGVVLIVGLAGFLLLQTTTVTSQGVRVGKVPVAAAACHEDDCLPEFTARTVDGQDISRQSLAGKTVMVNFWATWCGPCVSEIPALERTYQAMSGQGLVILGIATDGTDESIRKFMGEHGMSYPVVRANANLDRLFGRPAVLPTTFLYGPDGHLKRTWTRALSESDLATVLQ